jgi:hypothetical protein
VVVEESVDRRRADAEGPRSRLGEKGEIGRWI